MATKRTPTTRPTQTTSEPAKSHQILLMPSAQNAIAMEAWGQYAGKTDIGELVTDLRAQTDKVRAGNMGQVEAMLYGQAMTLQTIFVSLARRSALNVGEHMDAADRYMRLALKAQAQGRATLETLAIIKNPMPYIKQANIANGPQQINNGTTSHAGKFENQQNELLEGSHGSTYLDTRAAATADRGNPALETVEPVYRAKKFKR